MSFLKKMRWYFFGVLARRILWMWGKSTRMTVLGENGYNELKEQKKPLIILIWHRRILLAPYFFRRKGMMPLISPSRDGEIVASVVSRWGYKTLRGSGSHSIVKVWNEMKKELQRGGELIIVPDGPRGPDRKMKLGALKLAQETGAYLVPFTFSSAKKKILESWDRFLILLPFARAVALYGKPFVVNPDLTPEKFEERRIEMEHYLSELDEEADRYFEQPVERMEK